MFLYLSALFIILSPGVIHAAVVSGSRNTSVSSGLQLLWSLDGQDTSWGSQTVTDRSGNGRNGTITLMATSSTPTSGVIGQAFKFVDSALVAGVTSSSFAPGSTFTISFWMKNSQTSGTPVIMGWGNRFARISGVTLNKLNFSVDGATAGSAVTSCDVNDNKWHHIVFTSTASAQNIYCDTVAGTSATETLDTSAAAFVLGKAAAADSIKYSGLFDDVRIYSRVLTTSEISRLYSLGSGNKLNNNTNDRLTSNLIGLWSFDGADLLTNATDKSGQGNHGYVIGINSTTSSQTSGKVGQALKFDGTDDYVITGSTINGSALTNISYSFWFKTSMTSLGYIARWGSVWCAVNSTANKLNCTADGIASGSTVSNSNINDDKWHHAVYAIDGNNQTLYVDGASQSPATETLSAPNAIINIGRPLTTTNLFAGLIDDVRVYSRTLTATEAATLYKLGNQPVVLNKSRNNRVTNGLVGLWSFDGPDLLQNVADRSGQGNHGFMTNLTSTTTAVAAGKIGQALKFDGSNYIKSNIVTYIPSLDSPHSMFAWIYPTNLSTVQGIVSYGEFNDLTKTSALIVNSNGELAWSNNGQTNTFTSSGLPLTLNKWNHVGMVRTSSTQVTFYVNSVSATVARTDTTVVGTDPILIGASAANSTVGGFFRGLIDDVRVYNVNLSSTEVSKLYNLGI
jgi:hypothetical protein